MTVRNEITFTKKEELEVLGYLKVCSNIFQLCKHTFFHSVWILLSCVISTFVRSPPSQLWPPFCVWTFQLAPVNAEDLQCIR